MAELVADTIALEWLLQANTCRNVYLFSDSEYSRQVTTGRWKPRANFNFAAWAKQAYRAVTEQAFIRFVWNVDSHTGCIYNERADKLAGRGAAGILQGLPHY